MMSLRLPWIGQLGNRVLQTLKAAVTRGTGGNWSGAPPDPRPPRVTVQATVAVANARVGVKSYGTRIVWIEGTGIGVQQGCRRASSLELNLDHIRTIRTLQLHDAAMKPTRDTAAIAARD